ncbi:RpiR family transcriptional regulator [Spiroplasma clarkii]|uniref:MurR/RpiR family transcriptional regulator n=1 Tax=Spiroplasma clarkii TaxID=2139 RepID=A0A1Y0KZZ2_9MOLU|nr:MurR/RpiR family transcriptional regulator [Spiroplasma clarkii]ARU91332.1 RpiR family transcriptional regulator [Spiroplasma clarkii]ATX70754.1 MurR/RpiR family transcriptional regulator [Spiroplasma clarkii]
MSISNLYKKIQTKFPGMNENNQAIAKYLIEQWNEIRHISLKKISQATKQSPATIVRFCKEFGYQGFYQFRKSVLEINDNLNYNNLELIFKKDVFKDISTFEECYWQRMEQGRNVIKGLIANKTIAKITEMLYEANKIVIAGMNINYNQSVDFKNKMISIGKNCMVECDLHLLKSLAHTTSANDLVITISLSNENANIIQFGNNAKTNHAKWIHIFSKQTQLLNPKPDLEVEIDVDENGMWNLYSSRGAIIFYLFNVIFANYIIFQENEKN